MRMIDTYLGKREYCYVLARESHLISDASPKA